MALAAVPGSLFAQGPPGLGPASPVESVFRRLVRDLDSDHYPVRRAAQQRLHRLAAESDAQPALGDEIARVLRSGQVSFEVRYQLELVQRGLPASSVPGPPEKPSREEIRALVGRMEDDSYGARSSAAARLEWLLVDPEASGLALAAIRDRVAHGDLPADAEQWLEPIRRRAWAMWLSAEPDTSTLPPVAQADIERWIDRLAGRAEPAPGTGAADRQRSAEWQLRDVLARDDYAPRVRQAIEARLAARNLDPRGAERLTELANLCRPAMVAEFWQQRHHRGIQHLLVDVPSQTPGAPRPSHFDRIDDETAHCVSGSNLRTGDYPVGVAIPHPSQDDAFFHIVNLPTPRRRMSYDGLVKRDERVRLAEISRRTLDRFLRLKQPLAERELVMLGQLDPKEVSRFAGKFLLAVADEALPANGEENFGGRPSRHGLLCWVLTQDGTQEAVPGLLDAIRLSRVRPGPYASDWLAALGIATRDPWPEVDAWLGGLIGRTDPLCTGRADGPELGATAAAILLSRHQRTPTHFGLVPVREEVIEGMRLPVYRFTSPEERQRVLKWWEDEKAVRKAAG